MWSGLSFGHEVFPVLLLGLVKLCFTNCLFGHACDSEKNCKSLVSERFSGSLIKARIEAVIHGIIVYLIVVGHALGTDGDCESERRRYC